LESSELRLQIWQAHIREIDCTFIVPSANDE
jgi:hypothetical protein